MKTFCNFVQEPASPPARKLRWNHKHLDIAQGHNSLPNKLSIPSKLNISMDIPPNSITFMKKCFKIGKKIFFGQNLNIYDNSLSIEKRKISVKCPK